jgi:GNAT superfamily N-acetyltransferase
MVIPLEIVPITATLTGLDALRKEASDEGFRFIERLYQGWHANSNRFDKAGECLLVAWSDAEAVGIGGLNRDPYSANQTTGRLRHLYVRNSVRRTGVASALLKELLAKARGVFSVVQLRTDTPEAVSFYLSQGFRPVSDDSASHAINRD